MIVEAIIGSLTAIVLGSLALARYCVGLEEQRERLAKWSEEGHEQRHREREEKLVREQDDPRGFVAHAGELEAQAKEIELEGRVNEAADLWRAAERAREKGRILKARERGHII